MSIQGSKNINTEKSNRLDIVNTKNKIKTNISLAGNFSLEKEDVSHPFNYKTVIQYQQNNKSLIETAKLNKDFSFRHFYEADNLHYLICRKHKIVITNC